MVRKRPVNLQNCFHPDSLINYDKTKYALLPVGHCGNIYSVDR